MPSVSIAGKTHEIQRFDLVKALRVITLLNMIQRLVPDVAEELAKFTTAYREQHVEVLDRVQAKMRYGGDLPIYNDDNQPVVVDGKVMTVPAPIEKMTEKDWEQAGGQLKRPEDPATAALIAAVFPLIAERAEEPLMCLLAVCITPNDDFRRYVREEIWQTKAKEKADEAIAPAYLEEVMELAVTIGEVIEGQVLSKLDEMGERVGKLRRRFFPNRPEPATAASVASTPDAETSKTSGTSSSPSDTDGTPTSSEPSLGTPSVPSPDTGDSSTPTPSLSTSASKV